MNGMILKKIIKICSAILVCFFIAIMLKRNIVEKALMISKSDFAMGTVISVNLYGENISENETMDIIERIKKLDNKISWRVSDSDVYNINSSVVGTSLKVDSEVFEAIKFGKDICEASNGALDITIRPMAELWGIEYLSAEDFKIPDKNLIESTLEQVDYKAIVLGDNNVSKSKDIFIDLGAIGKGYALDVTRKELDRKDIKGAMISVGGSVMVYGNKNDNTNWRVGIRDPWGNVDDCIGYVSVKSDTEKYISTSGDYEKYIEKDGKRYHHIINPKTGYPSESDLTSVTILSDNGLVSDGLSTACFILGYDKSISLLEKYNSEAIFIYKNKEIKLFGDVDFVKQ